MFLKVRQTLDHTEERYEFSIMIENINIISISGIKNICARNSISEQTFRTLKRSNATMRIGVPKISWWSYKDHDLGLKNLVFAR